MPTTPNLALPYPILAHTADVPRDMLALANALDGSPLQTIVNDPPGSGPVVSALLPTTGLFAGRRVLVKRGTPGLASPDPPAFFDTYCEFVWEGTYWVGVSPPVFCEGHLSATETLTSAAWSSPGIGVRTFGPGLYEVAWGGTAYTMQTGSSANAPAAEVTFGFGSGLEVTSHSVLVTPVWRAAGVSNAHRVSFMGRRNYNLTTTTHLYFGMTFRRKPSTPTDEQIYGEDLWFSLRPLRLTPS